MNPNTIVPRYLVSYLIRKSVFDFYNTAGSRRYKSDFYT